MGKHWLFCSMCIATSAMAASWPACAEELLSLLSPDGKFREEMPEAPRASGQRLLGIQFGDASGDFDRAAFRISVGAETIGSALCVKVTTRDGRYWSLNPFKTDGVAPGNPALDFRTDLGARLADYDMSDFAVRAVAQDDCNEDVSGDLVPALLSAAAKPMLTLMVNGGNPLSVGARLIKGENLVSQAHCDRPSTGAMVGYNFICRLPTESAEGTANIQIFIKDMNGISSVESYQVRLPASGGNG